MAAPAFQEHLSSLARGLPDLERQISRIHAGHCSIKAFKSVLQAFRKTAETFDALLDTSRSFRSTLISELLRSAPEICAALDEVDAMFTGEGSDLTPHEGQDELFDGAVEEVRAAEAALISELEAAQKLLKCAPELPRANSPAICR